MSSRSRWFSSVAIVLLAVACSSGEAPFQEAVAGLEGARSYHVEYELITFFEGTAKPVVASGKIEFEGPGQWRIYQDSIEMVAMGPTIYIKDAEDRWRAEEMMELPVHPLLYLKAATDVRRNGDSEGSQTFAFTVDKGKYRQSLEQVLGVVPPEIDHVMARFRGTGEVTLDARPDTLSSLRGIGARPPDGSGSSKRDDTLPLSRGVGALGRPVRLRLQLQDASSVGKTRQELEIRFLDSAGDHNVRAHVGVGGFRRGGEGL